MASASRSEKLLNTILLACALTVTALVVRRELFGGTEGNGPRTQREWRQLGQKGWVISGSAGKVQLLVFSDFECPYCQGFASGLDSLIMQYPTQLRVVFRHFPLTNLHKSAFATAVAAECAGQQGVFKPFHDAAFKAQDSLAALPLTTLALRAGVRDTTVFQDCVKSDATSARVKEDVATAERIGSKGTPTIILNKRQFNGPPSIDSLRKLIEKLAG